MRFFRKTPKTARYTDTDIKESDILEAYTCWLKNEKLSIKQKCLLKNIQESTHFHRMKELIDFAHYRFQETESVTPKPGAKERVAEKLMKAIKGEPIVTSDELPATLNPQVAYSPQTMGNVDTDVFPGSQTAPTKKELDEWQDSDTDSVPETHTLANLKLLIEKQEDEVSITDLGSSTPTYVEGIRVRESAPIEEGSEFKNGDVTFKIIEIKSS